MDTLTYGMQVPEDGDRGSIFWDALEDNFTQLDAHDHDGVDSQKLTPASVTGSTQDIVAADWILVANGIYRQLVTMSGSLQFNEVSIECMINSGSDSGHIFYPTILRASGNTFYVYINNNALDVRIKYK